MHHHRLYFKTVYNKSVLFFFGNVNVYGLVFRVVGLLPLKQFKHARQPFLCLIIIIKSKSLIVSLFYLLEVILF